MKLFLCLDHTVGDTVLTCVSLQYCYGGCGINAILLVSRSNPECTALASASKDGTVNIWDVRLGRRVLSLCGHTHCVTCVRWGGEGLIYTSSQDRTIRVWRASDVSRREMRVCAYENSPLTCSPFPSHHHPLPIPLSHPLFPNPSHTTHP